MTPNAYLTDEVWKGMAEKFCKGIRAMQVVRKFPDLWMAMTMDGFGSHLEPEALEIFAKYRILLVKEEGD